MLKRNINDETCISSKQKKKSLKCKENHLHKENVSFLLKRGKISYFSYETVELMMKIISIFQQQIFHFFKISFIYHFLVDEFRWISLEIQNDACKCDWSIAQRLCAYIQLTIKLSVWYYFETNSKLDFDKCENNRQQQRRETMKQR